jgi:hypothetical protein
LPPEKERRSFPEAVTLYSYLVQGVAPGWIESRTLPFQLTSKKASASSSALLNELECQNWRTYSFPAISCSGLAGARVPARESVPSKEPKEANDEPVRAHADRFHSNTSLAPGEVSVHVLLSDVLQSLSPAAQVWDSNPPSWTEEIRL